MGIIQKNLFLMSTSRSSWQKIDINLLMLMEELKLHISIAGKLGSGKSTICNLLKANYSFQIYSTGAIHREIALQHKVSTLEMNQLMAQDLSYDHMIDDAVTKISAEKKNEIIIFDSRMAWKFAIKSFKVFVTVDPLVAANRVMGDPRGKEEVYTDLEDAKLKLIERGKLENERFKEIYGIDNFDYSNYNLVIDATYATPNELASIIYRRYQDYCRSSTEINEIIVSPTSLFPLEGIRCINANTLSEYTDKKEYLHSCISIIVFEGYHFIVDGHHRVLAAIMNNENFINVKMVDFNEYPFFASVKNLISEISAIGISTVYDFEEVGKYRYKSYPNYYFN